MNKNLVIGLVILTLSGLNVYLPEVGNIFDYWRVFFSIVSFVVGWGALVAYFT
jgi:hypothetical protein